MGRRFHFPDWVVNTAAAVIILFGVAAGVFGEATSVQNGTLIQQRNASTIVVAHASVDEVEYAAFIAEDAAATCANSVAADEKLGIGPQPCATFPTLTYPVKGLTGLLSPRRKP